MDPNATYDKSKETPTENQSNLARANFEFTQAIRRAHASDNKLSPGEILSVVASKFPEEAAAFVAVLTDDNSDVDDFITASHLVAQQYL